MSLTKLAKQLANNKTNNRHLENYWSIGADKGGDPNLRFASLCQARKQYFGYSFDPSRLAAQFVPHFNKGLLRRVKVQFPDEVVLWGYVGVSGGSKPFFLLLKTTQQLSSDRALTDACVIVETKDGTDRIKAPIT